MKKFLLLCSIVVAGITYAQQSFWSNNGALVSIKDGAFLSVLGDMYNSRQGHYNNSDSIFLTGDWSNTAGNQAFDAIQAGYVFLYGADQHIKGTSVTHFYNLLLQTSGVKHADLDVVVDGFLDFTDRELNADTNTIWVRNPLLTSVRRTSGFLSSLQNGGLLRYTNRDTAYLFPVGSNVVSSRYRPVELTPTSSQPNQYKVRFANTDPSNEGFDRNHKFNLVCQINPNWYHRIFHLQGSDSATLTLHYDPAADGTWEDIAHWQNVPRWERLRRDTIVAGTPFTRISKLRWSDYSYSPFALASVSEPFALAGVDTIMWRFDTITLQATGGIGYTWSNEESLSCSNCANPLAFPLKSTIYHLTVEDTKGCFDFDSLYVLVREKPITNLFIPDVITPNGDGFNDVWRIRDLEKYPNHSLRIINRWGDEILNETPYSQDWRGTWQGKELPGGTYYYVIKVRNDSGTEAVFNGPVTVVR